jgi:hypothetical protein
MILEADYAFELVYRGAHHTAVLTAGNDGTRYEIRVHARVMPRVARGRRGSRLWWRSAAARFTGPARLSALRGWRL